MKVKELIKELKTWPGNWEVATAFSDNTADEIQWEIHSLQELEDGESKDDIGPCVVLRA
jgi:hypothetical protein